MKSLTREKFFGRISIFFWMLLATGFCQCLAANDPALELRNAILEIENHAHDAPRKESVGRLLALLDRFSLPSQREDIFCAIGLFFHQRYNDKVEKPTTGRRRSISAKPSPCEAATGKPC